MLTEVEAVTMERAKEISPKKVTGAAKEAPETVSPKASKPRWFIKPYSDIRKSKDVSFCYKSVLSPSNGIKKKIPSQINYFRARLQINKQTLGNTSELITQ